MHFHEIAVAGSCAWVEQDCREIVVMRRRGQSVREFRSRKLHTVGPNGSVTGRQRPPDCDVLVAHEYHGILLKNRSPMGDHGFFEKEVTVSIRCRTRAR